LIFSLLRRDPAARVLPLMLVGFAVLGAMLGRAELERGGVAVPRDTRDLAVTMLMVTGWALINYFAVGKMHEIATPFEMALPIDARTLWAARLLSMTAIVSGGIVGYCVGFVFAYDAPIQRFQTAFGFNITAFAILIPFLYTAVRPRTPKWGMPLPVFFTLLGALIYGYVSYGLDTFAPGIVVLGATAILATTTYARLPKCFELPSTGRSGVAGPLARLSLEALDGVPGVGRLLDNSRALRPPAWFTQGQRRLLIALVLVLNLFALSMSPFVLVLVLVLAQFAWFVRTLNGGSRLAALPLRRGRVFLFATVPGLLVGALTIAALVAYLPDLSWGQVFSSKQAAVGFSLYAFAWWFTLSLLLDTLATPPAAVTSWPRRHLSRGKYWSAAGITLTLLVVSAAERGRGGKGSYPWEMSGGRTFLAVLADAIPLGGPPLWAFAVLSAVVAFIALRRGFAHVELVPATDF